MKYCGLNIIPGKHAIWCKTPIWPYLSFSSHKSSNLFFQCVQYASVVFHFSYRLSLHFPFFIRSTCKEGPRLLIFGFFVWGGGRGGWGEMRWNNCLKIWPSACQKVKPASKRGGLFSFFFCWFGRGGGSSSNLSIGISLVVFSNSIVVGKLHDRICIFWTIAHHCYCILKKKRMQGKIYNGA